MICLLCFQLFKHLLLGYESIAESITLITFKCKKKVPFRKHPPRQIHNYGTVPCESASLNASIWTSSDQESTVIYPHYPYNLYFLPFSPIYITHNHFVNNVLSLSGSRPCI